MENYEIRRCARQRYRKHIKMALLLAWIYGAFAPVSEWIIAFVLPDAQAALGTLTLSYGLGLLIAPLVLGAMACFLQLFEDDRADLCQLTQFYRRGQWLAAIALVALQTVILFVSVILVYVVSFLVFRDVFTLIFLIAGLIGVAWLDLRLSLAALLLVTGESQGATDALAQSFDRMKGNVMSYLLFVISTQWIPATVFVVGSFLDLAQISWAQLVVLAGQVLSFFFTPYIAMAEVGWLVQLIRRRPQETDATCEPENLLLRSIQLDRPASDSVGEHMLDGHKDE